MTRPDPVRVVLFDLDGTLVDTSYLHAVCWWQVLRQHDHTVLMASIHRAVGLGSDKILDHLLGSDRDHTDDDAMVKGHGVLFAQWHTRVCATPGAAELLRWCRDQGLEVVLATSGSAADVQALTAVLAADDAITDVTTSSDVKHSKPDTDLLTVALDRVGRTVSEAVLVGDAVWDAEAAARIGIAFIGLTCGGLRADELRQAGATEVYDDPGDLLSQVERSLLSRR